LEVIIDCYSPLLQNILENRYRGELAYQNSDNSLLITDKKGRNLENTILVDSFPVDFQKIDSEINRYREEKKREEDRELDLSKLEKEIEERGKHYLKDVQKLFSEFQINR
jgi:hypothetical protein